MFCFKLIFCAFLLFWLSGDGVKPVYIFLSSAGMLASKANHFCSSGIYCGDIL